MKGKIRIDKVRCKGCLLCIEACPSGVIAVDRKFNKDGHYPATPYFKDRCTGCGLCAVMCPDMAIDVYVQKKKRQG